MLKLTGTIYATPAAPSGISRVSAASGPYAAELSASSPKIGIPADAPICSARSSEVARGLPRRMSTTDMQSSRNGLGAEAFLPFSSFVHPLVHALDTYDVDSWTLGSAGNRLCGMSGPLSWRSARL